MLCPERGVRSSRQRATGAEWQRARERLRLAESAGKAALGRKRGKGAKRPKRGKVPSATKWLREVLWREKQVPRKH
eukprot:6203449-Pleurochrysis_carterae.AAC.1